MKRNFVKAASVAAGLAALSLLFSCKSDGDHSYSVETAELDGYAQMFFEYAEQYGYDFASDGLILRFADLDDSKGGVCYIDHKPILIEINRDYWNNRLTGKGNEEDCKQDLIFHEMAHGFLRREHTNETLANSEWKSIMRGDNLVNGRVSNIAFRGMRKEYYIKELFDSDAEAPWWSDYEPDLSAVESSETTVMQASGSSRYWNLSTTSQLSASIENGVYVVSNSSSSTNYYLPLNYFSLSVSGNFYYEAEIRLSSDDADSYAGIFFGNGQLVNDIYLTFNNSHKMLVSKTGSISTQLYFEDLAANASNKIALRRQSDTIYVYQNDRFVHHFELGDYVISGSSLGFVVPAASTVYVSSATIKTTSPYRSESEIVEIMTEPREFEEDYEVVSY